MLFLFVRLFNFEYFNFFVGFLNLEETFISSFLSSYFFDTFVPLFLLRMSLYLLSRLSLQFFLGVAILLRPFGDLSCAIFASMCSPILFMWLFHSCFLSSIQSFLFSMLQICLRSVLSCLFDSVLAVMSLIIFISYVSIILFDFLVSGLVSAL